MRAAGLQKYSDIILLVPKQLRQLPEYDQHNLYISSLVCPASKLLNENTVTLGNLG